MAVTVYRHRRFPLWRGTYSAPDQKHHGRDLCIPYEIVPDPKDEGVTDEA